MWLGPPYMNRKITLRAFGSKCGGRGASGLMKRAGRVSARAWLKKPSADSRPVRATAPKPAPVSQRNSRRVRPQNWRGIVKAPCISPLPLCGGGEKKSIEVDKLVRVQDHQAVEAQRLG